jgi:hypothetical protein
VNTACLSLKSRPVLKNALEEFPMGAPRVSSHPSIWRGVVCRWTLTLAIASLTACATHRGQPPECKGPFTPINQSSSVVSNGPQR